MYRTYEKYSTGLGVRFSQGLLFPLLKILLITILLYLVFSYIFIASFRLDSNSMYPTLAEKDRILVSPLVFGAKLPFLPTRLRGLKQPERGDLVVVLSPSYTEPSFPVAFLEPVIRFLTLQRGSIIFDLTGKQIHRHLIKRIIGLPGDTIKMSDFAVFIKYMSGHFRVLCRFYHLGCVRMPRGVFQPRVGFCWHRLFGGVLFPCWKLLVGF